MIAFQHNPILSLTPTLAQIFHHATAVWAAINQIANVNDGGRAVFGHVLGYPIMHFTKKRKMAMYVANRISVHKLPKLEYEIPGKVPPEF